MFLSKTDSNLRKIRLANLHVLIVGTRPSKIAMRRMKNEILDTISKYNMLSYKLPVVLGLSGGADSVALLHFLHNLKEFDLKIICVHVNHGLRGEEADRDMNFCINFCKQLNVEIVVFKEDAAGYASEMGLNLEEAGRCLRYMRFKEVMENYKTKHQSSAGKIAVAHNKNDAAETVLMQIFRGTGSPKGIAATKNNIIRPFINISRSDILAYCKENSLLYCDDSTNFEDIYNRNWLRNTLMPAIEQRWHGVSDALLRLACVSEDEDTLLDNLSNEAYEKCVKNYEIYIKEFDDYPEAIKRRVIRRCLHCIYGNLININFSHIESISALTKAESGKQLALPKGFTAQKTYDKIIFQKFVPASNFSVTLPKDTKIFISEIGMHLYLGKNPKKENTFTMALDCGKIEQVEIRTRLPGDKIYFNSAGTKKIKDFFIDKKIPRYIREKAVFIACEKDIILMITNSNFIESDKFRPDADDDTIYLQIWEDAQINVKD